MAVHVRDSCCAIVDQANCVFEVVSSISEQGGAAILENKSYGLKKALFEVNSPFYTDSQSQRLVEEASKTSNDFQKESSAQRKMSILIEHSLSQLIEKARDHKLFLTKDIDFHLGHMGNNNQQSRLASSIQGCGDTFPELCNAVERFNGTLTGNSIVLDEKFLSSSKSQSLLQFIHTFVENPKEAGVYLNAENGTFLIPARSRFLMSNFSSLLTGLHHSLAVSDGYDFIVLDPPWINKSVKRKKSYQTFDECELFSLPIQSLTKPNGLICLWVTNNERIISFIKEELFPSWHVTWVADWFWMKVTRFAEPVCDIRSPHKKPYERLIIGRMKYTNEHTQHNTDILNELDKTKSECNVESTNGEQSSHKVKKAEYVVDVNWSKEKEEKVSDGKVKDPNEVFPCIPQDYVFLSVPCSLHSKKPPLTDLFSPFLPSEPRCLELFARNLVPHWTCWGNEVLRHQHIDYYEEIR